MTIPFHPVRKIKEDTAEAICRRVELSAEAGGFLTAGLSPQGFLSLLAEAGLLRDAVRFLAFALPAREGVWWAAMAGEALLGAGDPCYEAAQDWVYEPSDERRFACLSAAEGAGSSTPGAYAALAAFWSSGSMTPPDMPEALPDPALSPTGVAASVLLAVAAGDPARADADLNRAILLALDIGNGGSGRDGPETARTRRGTGA